MTLDHDSVKPEKHAAIGLAGIHLAPQRLEGATRKQIADPGQQGARHRAAQIFGELPRRALGRLQRDITAESLSDDDVGRPLADTVSLDEADEFELRQIHRPQQFRSFADFLSALDILDADVEEAYRRTLQIEQNARHGATHDR